MWYAEMFILMWRTSYSTRPLPPPRKKHNIWWACLGSGDNTFLSWVCYFGPYNKWLRKLLALWGAGNRRSSIGPSCCIGFSTTTNGIQVSVVDSNSVRHLCWSKEETSVILEQGSTTIYTQPFSILETAVGLLFSLSGNLNIRQCTAIILSCNLSCLPIMIWVFSDMPSHKLEHKQQQSIIKWTWCICDLTEHVKMYKQVTWEIAQMPIRISFADKYLL